MIQSIFIIVLFLAALAYLSWSVRKQFSSKTNSCAKGCGCSSVDLKKVEQEIANGKK
jgi:hypothetical protein